MATGFIPLFGGSILAMYLVSCVVSLVLFVFVLCLVSNGACVHGLSILFCLLDFL
jgi:hypothetical protein